MGCCNGSVLVLVVCTIQLVTILERLVMDFHGFLYLAIIPGFVQIVAVIIAIFGLCLYKPKLVIVYLVWNVIYIAWNIFVICLFLGVGSLTQQSHLVLGFGTSSSWWIRRFPTGCTEDDTCVLEGQFIEVIHACIQILLSMIACASSAFVIYLLREKDDTNPVFQVYKVPSSRRSSISLRMDRETSLTRPEPWEASGNGRDSIRSNRSSRSISRAKNTDQSGQSGTRQSKRSSRGSTRSRKSSNGRSGGSQNGSAKANRPNALPWAPTIAPSSGIDSDVPQTPQTPPSNRQHLRGRGHENESYGYSSSENPYTDQQRQGHQFISPGPPSGPAPAANRRYRPTDLAQSFNAVADLPPPLDEGPEAYSRDSVAFPAPPPPLSDGPEPYRSTHQQNRNDTRAMHTRPTQIVIPPTPTKQALSSSPSSPGSSSLSTEKSATDFNCSRTLENNLDRPSYTNKSYQRPPFPVHSRNGGQQGEQGPPSVASSQPSDRGRNINVSNQHHPYDQSEQVTGSISPRNEATSNPLYANHQFDKGTPGNSNRPTVNPRQHTADVRGPTANPRQPTTDVHRPAADIRQPAANVHRPTAEINKPSANVHRPAADIRQPAANVHWPAADLHRPVTDIHRPSHALPSKPPYRGTESASDHGETGSSNKSPSGHTHTQRSPTSDLRQIRSHDSQPKDNTFKRLVTGNLSVSTGGTGVGNARLQASSNDVPLQQMYTSQNQLRQTPQNSRQPIPGLHQMQPTHQTNRTHPHLYDRSRDNNNSAPNVPTFNGTSTPVKHESSQPTKDYSSTNVPPWGNNKPPENTTRNISTNNQRTAVQQPPVTAAPNTYAGTLKEVTSSYGGLYSSRQSPAPSRRRGNPRPSNGQSHPSTNKESYQSTNITDDVKTTKGAFVSSQPSVI